MNIDAKVRNLAKQKLLTVRPQWAPLGPDGGFKGLISADLSSLTDRERERYGSLRWANLAKEKALATPVGIKTRGNFI